MKLQDYIELLKARLESLRKTQKSKAFEDYYKSYSEFTYKEQYDYIAGKIYELERTIADLERLEKLTFYDFPNALVKKEVRK